MRPISSVLRRAAVAAVAVLVAVPLIAARADAYIYWSSNPEASVGVIGRANNDSSGASRSFMGPLYGGQAVAIDDTYIYWANGPNNIGKAKLDGTVVNPSYITGIFTANALAVDPVSHYLFWADQKSSTTIGRATLGDTATDVRLSFIPTFTFATGIAIDSATRTVYFTTNNGNGKGVIGRANEDTGSSQPNWITGLFGAQGLTTDGTYLYWANGAGQIGQVKLDGSGIIPNYIYSVRVGTPTSAPQNFPVPLVVHGGYIYYGNYADSTIGRVPNVPSAADANNSFISLVGKVSGLALNDLASPGPLPPPSIPDLSALEADVQRIGLSKGIERSLLAKVDAFGEALAAGDHTAACDRLTAYANQLDALTGKKVPLAPGTALIADVRTYRATLGCVDE